jgi:alanyl aminopeptidase
MAFAIAGHASWASPPKSTHTSASRPARSTRTGPASAPRHAAAAAAPDSAPPRLEHDAVPTFEAVELTLDPEQTGYRGTARVDLKVHARTNVLRFHARALTLDDVALRGAAGDVRVSGIERLQPDQARVRLAASLEPGDYQLSIRFHNEYDTRAVALYRVVTGGRGYLFTQFEDTEAREAFPCWDEPEFKIPWTLTLTVPARDLAISNTPIVRETPQGAMKRVEFMKTRPLPSYLIAVAVGPFETVPIRGMSVPGRVVTVRGASAMAGEAANATGPIIRSLERYFGRPYPYEKLDLIAAPEFLYGAMENAGAVVFADRALLIDPHAASPDQRRRVTGVIAHELAHQWFGDLVTMKWWDDLWLNESFASWMATKVMDDVFPENRSGITTLYGVERALTIDARPSTRAMRSKVVGATSLGQTANELTYNKGEAVLDMFEGWLGREKFRQGVLLYLQRHEWGNAEAHDLWQALGTVSGQDIDAAMSTFLDQAGEPLVTVEPLGGGRVRLRQQRFLTVGQESGAPVTWRIPVILRVGAGGASKVQRVWLTERETIAQVGPRAPSWIDPNADASGYYRWSVPDAMLDSLVAHRRQLTPRERIDLVAGLGAQLRAGALHGDRFLSLAAPLANDPAPEVVRAVVGVLNDLWAPLTTERDAEAFQGFLRSTLQQSLARYGATPRPGEPVSVALMRPDLLFVLARVGHDSRVMAYAESLGRAYRRNPSSIPASLAETGIVLGAVNGDRALFDEYRRRFETTNVPIERPLYLAGLGSFRDPALREAALDYALHGPLRPQEPLMIPSAMALNSLGADAGRGSALIYSDEVTEWMLAHFDELRAKLPPNFGTRIMNLGGGYSADRVRRLRAFFADPAHKVQGGDPTLQRMSDAIEECASVHTRESQRVERWLSLHVGQP